MKKSIRERIDRARCNPANIRDARRQSAQQAWRDHGETFRRAVAERDERRRAKMAAGQDPTQSPDYVMHDESERSVDYCEPRDETTPYPHGPGYHLTVNGKTDTFVDYTAAIIVFVGVINATLESGLTAVEMDLVGPDVRMGFMFERTTDVPSPAVDAEGRR